MHLCEFSYGSLLKDILAGSSNKLFATLYCR